MTSLLPSCREFTDDTVTQGSLQPLSPLMLPVPLEWTLGGIVTTSKGQSATAGGTHSRNGPCQGRSLVFGGQTLSAPAKH